MAGQSQVDIQGMVAAQGSFQTALDETSRSYAQMDGQIMGLHGSWSGDAASIFSNAMQEWLNDFNQVNGALQRMLEQLSANTNVYGNVHTDTQDKANQVAQAMAQSGLPNFAV
ncbi:WXG100 family type VII secretion target [Streptomyces sp. NPDC054775]